MLFYVVLHPGAIDWCPHEQLLSTSHEQIKVPTQSLREEPAVFKHTQCRSGAAESVLCILRVIRTTEGSAQE